MSRVPTPKEIRETNKSMVYTCDGCLGKIKGLETGGAENALHLSLEGGYGEFVDTAFLADSETNFTLCHECGHKLFSALFKLWDISHYHANQNNEPFCDGLTLEVK